MDADKEAEDAEFKYLQRLPLCEMCLMEIHPHQESGVFDGHLVHIKCPIDTLGD